MINILMLSALAVASAQPAPKATCFLSLDKPLDDHAAWSAECGYPGMQPVVKKSGFGENLLDTPEVPKCVPAGAAPVICDNPDAPFVGFDPTYEKILKFRPKNWSSRLQLPCYPAGRPDYFAIGPLQFHRSCFRVLPKPGDYAKLSEFKFKTAMAGLDARRAGCSINEFGMDELHSSSASKELDSILGEFIDDYPAMAPRTAAQAILRGYEDALGVVDGCLEKLNPALAERMRQAMGIHSRASGELYRPKIECREQVALQCDAEQVNCREEKYGKEGDDGLEKKYREKGEVPSRPYDKLLREEKCWPAHPNGETLGSINDANLIPGSVCKGTPEIQFFNPTARYDDRKKGGPSTIFHEFLHAAGAESAPDHNHGTAENEAPHDQVYACQAVAYQAYFPALSDADLIAACHRCAGLESDPKKHPPVGDKCDIAGDVTKGLRKLGCRLR